MQKTAPSPFEFFGKFIAFLAFALVGMPIINVLFGALGGYIVQTAASGWVVAGASALGLTLDPARLWQVGAFLAWVGTYFRMPAKNDTRKD